MSSQNDAPRERAVLRSRSAYVIFGLVAIVVIVMVVDGFARGAVGQTFLVLPWLIAILWFIYLVLLRPCVVIDTQGVTVVNVFRRHRIPWPRLTEIGIRYQLTLTRDDGRTVSSWGAPTTGIGARRHRRAERPTPSGQTLSALESMRRQWAAAAPDAASRSWWEGWTILVSILVVVLCAWAVVVTR